MSFRDPEHAPLVAVDPLDRFFALEAAFEAGRGLLGDRTPLRLAAAQLVRTPGDPAALAGEVRAMHVALEGAAGWNPMLASSLWLLVAAVLVARGDAAAPFVAELHRVRERMRAHGVRRHAGYELIATIALRAHSERAPVDDARIARTQAIYAAMKRHHWWLTGPEDLPACAILVSSEREPAELAARAHAIYQGLRGQARVWPGERLQLASNTLALSPLEPAELVDRFLAIALAFEQAGSPIGVGMYDDLALLSFLAQPTAILVETVQGYRAAMHERLAWADRELTFDLASNLAYVRLLGDDPQLGVLADVKALAAMQQIIDAQGTT